MSNKKKLLILLHGYGADGNDLLPIGEHIQKKIPNIEFISPNAFDKCEMNPFGYQWFHIDEDRRYIFDQNIQNVTDRVFNEYIKKEHNKCKNKSYKTEKYITITRGKFILTFYSVLILSIIIIFII